MVNQKQHNLIQNCLVRKMDQLDNYFQRLSPAQIEEVMAKFHQPDIYTLCMKHPSLLKLNFRNIEEKAINIHSLDKSGWIRSKCTWCGQKYIKHN